MATGLAFSRRDYVLERHRHDPDDPYWCLRVCEEVRPRESAEIEALWATALARVEEQIAIPDPSLASYVKGVLWSIGLRFEKPPPVEHLRHAADLLERVEARHRTGFYYENLC